MGLPQGTHNIRIVKSCIIFLLDTKTHRYEIAVNVYVHVCPQFPCENDDPGVPKTFQTFGDPHFHSICGWGTLN